MFDLKVLITVHHPGKSGKEPRGRTEAETMEECFLMPCSPLLVQPASLYKPDPPAQEWHCPQSAGPCKHQSRKYLPTAQSDGGSCSAEASSQATPACFKLTTN